MPVSRPVVLWLAALCLAGCTTYMFNPFNPLFHRLDFVFLPVGRASVEAERGRRYVLRAEVKGAGSTAEMVHYWWERAH